MRLLVRRIAAMLAQMGRAWPIYALGVALMGMQGTLYTAVIGKAMRFLTDVRGRSVAELSGVLAPLLVQLLAVVLASACGMACTVLLVVIAEKNLSARVLRSILRAPAPTLLARHSGEWIAMATQHPQSAVSLLNYPLIGFMNSLIGPLTAVVLIVLINPWLSLFPLFCGACAMTVNFALAPRMSRLMTKEMQNTERATAQLLELWQGHSVIRAFRCAERCIRRYMDVARAQYAVREEFAKLDAVRGIGTILFCSSIGVMSIAVGAVLVRGGLAGIGEVIESSALAASIVWSIQYLTHAYAELVKTSAAVERVEGALSLPQEQNEGATAGPSPVSCVSLRNVVFSYPSRPEEPVLRGLSFDLLKGESLALVGPSGGGKSTVFTLLLRLYDAREGSLEVEGAPLHAWRTDALRARFALVPQLPQLFDGSVARNIELGRPGASMEDIRRAAALAYADEFIEALPEGYDTRVGERGAQLSGGQCQRIAIARAFLKDAPILLLDEATSALDGVSEAAVMKAMTRLMDGRTVLLIAHRLSTARGAGRVAYIENGRIGASGTHEELMAGGGAYAALWHAQNA